MSWNIRGASRKKAGGPQARALPGLRLVLWRVGSVLFALLLWQLGAMALNSQILLASPLTVAGRLGALAYEVSFWGAVGFSLWRIALGFLLSLVLGAGLAVFAWRFRTVDMLLWPFMAVIKATPVASFIVLCLIWLSSGSLSIFIAFLMVLPVVYTNLLTGLRATDANLLEMAALFHVGTWKRIRFLYMPAVNPYLVSACTVGLGLSWKAGIAAEVIGIPAGSIGEKLYEAKIYLSSPDLFAWTVVVVLVSIAFEKLVLWAMKRYLYRKPIEREDRRIPSPSAQSPGLGPLVLQNVQKHFGSQTVFNGVSHSFGVLTSVMGPSGCGKTTLLRILMGLETMDGGAITGLPETVAPMFQEDRLCLDFSAVSNLTLVPGIGRQAAEAALHTLGIDDTVKPVRAFSGGMKRRVALIRAMLSAGELVILDEPFKGLDEAALQTAAAFIHENRRGRRLILVTHHPEEAALLGGEIYDLKA